MKQQDVHLFVFDGLADWEPGYAVAGINNPRFQLNPGGFRIRTVALQRSSVVTMGGVRIEPDMSLDNMNPAQSAMLILPGGESWDAGANREAVDVAEAFLKAGLPVAAICGATAALARGGLLDTRRHTSNAREYLAATQYQGKAFYVCDDSLAVTDGDLITASGLAPIDFAQHIFKKLNLYSSQVLDAWYGLYKTGKAEYFGALMQAIRG
ncbi:glutamine amidotransferase [Rhodoferax lacus]|uniref:Glutamine amidotransferase n=1 Tax=Rhodoferax lacus TaxID=2184758 RepID=A0A3E1RHY3_9BURK|nr:type 1 glutamine amidotransferase family protein [Rhodoferax lacus]RFO98987.1 glutamine amidotransferase [Rhodoferax lacus]